MENRSDCVKRRSGPSLLRHLLIALYLATWTPVKLQAQVLELATQIEQGGSFPSEWYVHGGEGLDELRKFEGQAAQEISVGEWRGESTTLAELKGKVVVLDFWATWCGPCMAAIPKNVAFIEKYRERGVALIGIHDAKSGWDSVDRVIDEKGITYPVALDKAEGDSGATTKAYRLMFWPTYFVIDRAGIVRGAGIRPDKVEDVVQQLLAESPSAANMLADNASSRLPDTWFLGGSKRLESMRALEGTRAADLALSDWIGDEPDRSQWDQQVRVVQFVRPELSVSVGQLRKLQAVADRFAKQGVVFMAVCDARSSRDTIQALAESERLAMPIAIDGPSPDEELDIGATANSLGIKFSPNTIVIDRQGVLRVSGLKPDFLDQYLNQLLAEALPATPDPSVEPEATEPTVAEATVVGTTLAESTVFETEDEPEPAAESGPRSDQTSTYAKRPDEGQPPSPEVFSDDK